MLRKIAVARFTRTLGTLLQSGVPILDALEIVAKTAGNVIVDEAIMYARQRISEGKNMAEPLTETKVFPSMVVQMIAVGEQTGALDQMLNKIADFYEEEVDVAVAALTSLLEPIMMVGIGGMVGVVLIVDVPADLRLRRQNQGGLVSSGPSSRPTLVQQLTSRLGWLVALRLLFLTLLFGLTASFYLRSGFASEPIPTACSSSRCIVTYLVAGVYYVALRRKRYVVELAYAELVIDQATWTALIYVTGGATSGATALYGLTCLGGRHPHRSARALRGGHRRGAVLLAALRGFVSGADRRAPRPAAQPLCHRARRGHLPFFINLLVLWSSRCSPSTWPSACA